MENHKLISVIIPVYNGEKYIAQCIENMLHQSYKNLEILVIDDGSTDNSAKIAETYPIRVIRQENQGPSSARNAGMDAARGAYIHFMDVDDLINLDYYRSMIDAILQTDADMACGGMVNEIKPHRTILYPDRLLVSLIDDKLSITQVGKRGYAVRYLFKKTFLEEKKLRFEVGRLVEDLPFSLTAVYHAKNIATVPGAVYYYKRRANSNMMSHNPVIRKKRHEGWVKAKAFRQQFAIEHNIQIPGVRSGKFSRYIEKWFA
jgi:glycosyltransferase involved in cell wall biosynthesis